MLIIDSENKNHKCMSKKNVFQGLNQRPSQETSLINNFQVIKDMNRVS